MRISFSRFVVYNANNDRLHWPISSANTIVSMLTVFGSDICEGLGVVPDLSVSIRTSPHVPSISLDGVLHWVSLAVRSDWPSGC